VRTNANSKVTRTASSHVRSVHPGDTVTVVGTKARSGTITATQITATAKGASGFPGGFGGAGPPSGAGFPGAAAGGTARSGQGAAPGG
jgi:hypothetical protein